MYKSFISCVAASAFVLASVAPGAGYPACRPKLKVTDARLSEMKPPNLERRWTATVLVDASLCAANVSGYFDLGITRLKESGYELDFREQFIWLAPSVKVSVDFWTDEAVEQYWIENVTPCRCADQATSSTQWRGASVRMGLD